MGFGSSWVTQSPWSRRVSQVPFVVRPGVCTKPRRSLPTHSPRLAAVTQETRASLFVNSAAFIRARAPARGKGGEDTGCFVVQAGWKEGDGMRPKKCPRATAGLTEPARCDTAHTNPPILQMGKLRQGVTRELMRVRGLKKLLNLPNLF